MRIINDAHYADYKQALTLKNCVSLSGHDIGPILNLKYNIQKMYNQINNMKSPLVVQS
jgi:hypothetical protein